MSTPALRMTISSSSTSERPVLEKKTRPPGSSLLIAPIRWESGAREFRNDGALLVETRLHPAGYAFRLELGLILRVDEGVFHPVRNGGAALGNIHAGVVDVLFAGRAWLATRIVRSEPCRQPQRLLRGAEMLVIPARAAGSSRYHADRLIVDPPDLVGMAVLPGSDAVTFRPGV